MQKKSFVNVSRDVSVWILAGKAHRTAEAYVKSLAHIMNAGARCDPVRVWQWVLEAEELSVRGPRSEGCFRLWD
jgi:hypothetical protein